MNLCVRLIVVLVTAATLGLAGCVPGPSCSEAPGGPGTPTMTLTSIPPMGSTDNLKGNEQHAIPANYEAVAFINVPNQGWWIKPTFADPTTTLSCGGEFSIPVNTGGNDGSATQFVVFLLPSGYHPPLLNGAASLPASLYQSAVAVASATR